MDYFVAAMLFSGNLLLWHFFKKLAISRVLEMHVRAFFKSFIDYGTVSLFRIEDIRRARVSRLQ